MRKLLAAVALAAICGGGAWAAPSADAFWFVEWNPGAALSLAPAGFVLRSILPVALFNLEAGAALGGGYTGDHQALEARLCVGNSNATYLVVQAQLGWTWLFGEAAGWMARGGPYAGAALRYWDLVQRSSLVQSHNLAPLIELGWRQDMGRLFVDMRVSQALAVASLSSAPGSLPGAQLIFSPLPGISPWLPLGMVEVGLRL
jgi:hypothetical protein